jgi:hypothetical protein
MSKHEAELSIGCGPRTSIIYSIFALATAIIGKHIHGSVFWAVIDFFFMPFAWLKWVIYQEVNLSIIKGAFEWFLQ